MKINMVGPVNPLGYGVAFTNLVMALSKTDEVSVFPIGPYQPDASNRECMDRGVGNARFYDDSAPSVRVFHETSLAEHVGWGPKVGFPFFELDPMTPVAVHHLNRMDLVLVASEWAKGVAVRSGVVAPIASVPLGVDRSIFHEAVACDRLDPDQTVFFSVGKWEVRKGHDLVISAFNRAFGPADRVVLRLMCENPIIGTGGNRQWEVRAMTSPMGAAGRIRIEPRVATQRDVARFMASCDVGVFPSRAEGWNLELLEAMSTGKPVIATNYSAHTAYCTRGNSLMIDVVDTEPACDGVFFRGEGNWASFGPGAEEVLVYHMRECHRLKQTSSLPPNAAGVETAKMFSWHYSASRLRNAILGS